MTRFLRRYGAYLALIFVLASLLGFALRGINPGIDFSGGTITEFATSQALPTPEMQQLLGERIDGKFILGNADGNRYWILRQPADNQSNTDWIGKLRGDLKTRSILLTVRDADYIDAQVGHELLNQGGLALLTALLITLVYLASRFEWRFAVAAIIALIHDLIVVLGLFAWSQLEFDLSVLAALLAIIGYSLNDSIIVADRVRELMRLGKQSDLGMIVDEAIATTLTRTLITSGTTLATIVALWLLAGRPLQGFSIALFSGILVGTLSSISVATTLPQILGLQANYFQQKAEVLARLSQEP